MTRDESLEYIHEHSRDYATETWGKDGSGKGWICPLCGSGSHGNGTGITTKDGVHFTCWAGCFTNADVIDIIGLVRNIPELDYEEKFEAARREFGIEIDSPLRASVSDKRESLESFFLEANGHLGETDYHRGISLETLNRFKVGYVEAWRHPKASQGVEVSPRLIIPLSPMCYLARDTRTDLTLEQSRYKKQLVGSRGGAIFNGDALTAAKEPVFITEGELDAMSVIDVGGEAVTSGSAGQWRNVFEAVRTNPQPYPVIVALDNDETGGARGRDLKRAFDAEGIAYMDYIPPMGAKDANEALMKDREVFAESIRAAVDRAVNMKLDCGQQSEAEQEYISAMSVSASLRALAGRVESGTQTRPLSTGFNTLDRILDGGLRPGLYVLGAIQSLGKTAFCMQIMDSIAEAGNDVLVFSLEMSREELIARSLSRITYELLRKSSEPGRSAYGTAELLLGSCYEAPEGRRCVMEAIREYSRYSDRVFIFEGIGDVTAGQILETAKKHIQLTGRRPVVLCDYLQIMPVARSKGRTDKQNIDYNVVALKRMSRDLSIPVVAISSFNRQNYLEPLNPGAFKESGAIEYSADVLMGLQYQGMEYQIGDEKESQRARRVSALIRDWEKRGKEGKPQGLHLKVMKNRTGYKDSACFNYYPAFNFFECNVDADERGRKIEDMWTRSIEKEIKANSRELRVH